MAYDRACDLHPFLCNLEKKGVYFAQFLLKNVQFFVGRFHIAKQTEPCCLPPSEDNTRSYYHPDLPKVNAVKGANTECAEQSPKWLNKYKNILINTGLIFFLHTIINLHSLHREAQLRQSGLL